MNDRLAVLSRAIDDIQHASSSAAGWQIAFQRFPRHQVIESATTPPRLLSDDAKRQAYTAAADSRTSQSVGAA